MNRDSILTRETQRANGGGRLALLSMENGPGSRDPIRSLRGRLRRGHRPLSDKDMAKEWHILQSRAGRISQ